MFNQKQSGRWDQRDSEEFRECWRHHLHKIYPNPFFSPFHEVILTGGIGTGKTTGGNIIGAKDIENIQCMGNPHARFGLDPTTVLVFAVFSATLKQVQDVAFQQIMGFFDVSPYFKDLRKRSLAEFKKKVSEQDPMTQKRQKALQTLFPKRTDISVGSVGGHGLGKAIFAAEIDESNFGGRLGQAKDTYTTLRRRIQTRFMEAGGGLPGHMILISSRKDDTDFLDEHIEKVKDSKGVYVVEMPIWEAKPQVYSGHSFPVFAGDTTTDPFIIDESNIADRATLDESNIIYFPEEHREDCLQDIYGALKDLAGRSTITSKKLITKPALLEQAMYFPIITSQQVIRLSLKGSDRLIDYVYSHLLGQRADPQAPRFIHCDFSLTGDRTGVACSYNKGFKKIERYDPLSGTYKVFSEPTIKTEWVIYLQSRPGEEIPLFKILEFIVDLRDSYKYHIGLLSTDGFQSADFRQRAEMQHFKTDVLSLDKSKDPYIKFRIMVNDGRWEGPRHPLLLREFVGLRDTGKKFDHGTDKEACFVGETEVRIRKKEGEYNIAMEALSKEVFAEISVLSYDQSKGTFCFSKLNRCWESKIVEELIEIELDEGTVFRCTPDHLILTRRGYVQAQELTLEDELISA